MERIALVIAVAATAGAAAAAVGMGAAMYASSLGAAAATVATVSSIATTATAIACGTVIAADIAIGMSNTIEVVTDGYNPIRDDFMGGSQQSYDTLQILAGGVSATIIEVGSNFGSYQKSVEEDLKNSKESTIKEKINDISTNPQDWLKSDIDTTASTNKNYKNGWSVEMEFTNKYSGETIYQHNLIKSYGAIKDSHYRNQPKQITRD